MDGAPSGLHDRLGSLSKHDGNASRKSKEENTLPHVSDPSEYSTEKLVQRTVIIQRDEKGYGLTVSGDNPVYVQSVKEDGAAARAGVQQGDQIIKVNGTLATQCNHQEVVKLIKSGSYVALTLLGRQVGQSNWQSGTPQPLPLSGNAQVSHGHSSGIGRLSSPSERITGPQPVDPEKQQQLSNARNHTIRKMLEKEKIYLEKLHSEYNKTPSEKIKNEIQSAAKRVKTLEDQLHNLPGFHYDGTTPRSPRSPPPPRHHMLTESESFRSVLGSQHQSGRMLLHQASAPTLPKTDRPPTLQWSPSGDSPEGVMPPPHSPNHHTRGNRREAKHRHSPTQLPLSTSLENIAKPSSPKSGAWLHGGPTHSRQSSNPDALLHQVENLRQQRIDSPRSTDSEGGLTRTQSEITGAPPGRKISASEAVGDGEGPKKRRSTNSSSRGSSFGQYDSAVESPHNTPPGTPPLTDSQTECSDMGETVEADESSNQEEHPGVVKVEQPSAPVLPNEGRPDLPNNNDGRPLSATPGELKSASPLTSPSQQYGTPPESQVSPVGQISKTSAQQPFIVCMDDDDFPSDSEMGQIEDHGPFKSLWKLVRHQAHLAVFLHYLISNSDPSSLFFYIISDWYRDGTVKEMKKWAYEIHSTFLVPNAPLRVNNIDETILHEIDDVLQNYIEKEEVLKSVFTKARNKAQEEITELLAAFRNTRTIGLGAIFGPPDYQLEEAEHDKNKELKIIESLLLPALEILFDDLDNLNDRDLATVSALATVLKQFGVKSPQATSIIERCPTFVAKDRTKLRFLKGNKKVIAVQDHQFLPQHYYCVTYCNHCQLIIWGVGNQGYQCQKCEMNIHKACVRIVEESCIGALRNKKDRKNNRVSEIVENIIGKNRKPSQPVPAAIERAKLRWNEEMIEGFATLYGEDSERAYINRSEKQRDRAELSGGEEQYPQTLLSSGNDLLDRNNGSKKGSSIGRSESFRQRRENRPSFRKRSDPNIPRSKSDVDVEDKPTNLNNSGSSSNSSLSARSLDSPSNSLEMVHRTPTGTPADSVAPVSSPSVGPLSHVSSSSSSSSTVHQYDDSDLEAETDPPNWQDNVEWDVILLMKPKEKKRQDVINELFHTERTHVRNLKVLDRLFYRPLLQEQLLPPDLLHLLFPNLEEMLDIHINFNTKMKAKRREEPVVGDIGEMMLSMFDGASGENLKRIAANFCRNQSIALESLKNKQRKDQKLANFLAEAEAHHLCRRLQLKDIIAAGFQRLTKYPLLLENIAKYTAPNKDEYTNLLKAVECSKQILNHVNQAVKEAENQHRLSELQRRLEKSAFEKVEHQIAHMYRNLDLTKHKLLHEGSLTWKLNKKSLDMHVVLLEDILVLLQKQDDKYVLKFHSMNLMAGREDTKLTHSPILRVQNLLPRNVATDKKGFFLVSTSEQQAIYELSANSPSERKIWLKHITEAAEAYKRNQNVGKVRDHQVLSERTESAEEPPEEPEQRAPEITNNQNQINNNQESNDAGESSDAGDHSDVSSSTMQGAQTPTESPPSVPPEPATTPSATSPDVSPQKEDVSASAQDRKSERRLQRVEILKIADGPQLIEPQEVVVSYGAVLQTAEPVLTPVEKLRRKDQQIATALKEKHELVADILQIPPEEYDNVAELASEMEGDKDVKELLLAAIYQANRLDTILNETLRVTEEDAVSASSAEMVPEDENALVPGSSTPSPKVPRRRAAMPGVVPSKLINISTALNRQLTQLLGIITEREEERKQLQKELHNSREQIHLLHEAHRRCSVRCQSPSNQSTCHSRPNSFISIASSVSEGMCDSGDPPQFLCPEDAALHKSGGTETVPRSDCKTSHPETPIPEQFETVEETECQADDSAGEMFVDALTDTPNHQEAGQHCQTTDLDHDSETECSKVDNECKAGGGESTIETAEGGENASAGTQNEKPAKTGPVESAKADDDADKDKTSENVGGANATDAVYF